MFEHWWVLHLPLLSRIWKSSRKSYNMHWWVIVASVSLKNLSLALRFWCTLYFYGFNVQFQTSTNATMLNHVVCVKTVSAWTQKEALFATATTATGALPRSNIAMVLVSCICFSLDGRLCTWCSPFRIFGVRKTKKRPRLDLGYARCHHLFGTWLSPVPYCLSITTIGHCRAVIYFRCFGGAFNLTWWQLGNHFLWFVSVTWQ